MRELYRDDFLAMTLDDAAGVVRRARTERPFPRVEDADASYAAVVQVLERLDRSRYGLLVDMRLAPPRNDLPYEQVVARYRVPLYRGFRRVAFVARTEAGRLQVTRLVSTHPEVPPVRAFLDEPLALAWLSERHDSVPPLSERRAVPPSSRRGG